MTIDITDNAETQILRDKWLARGVPSSLFDAFIAEANLEYNSSIGYEDYNRFAMLTVNLTDTDTTTECFYLYALANYGLVIQGNEDVTITHVFGQVPCISLDIEVFKVKNDYSQVVAYGQTSLLHTKDEVVSITMQLTGITEISKIVLNDDFEGTQDTYPHYWYLDDTTLSTVEHHSGTHSLLLNTLPYNACNARKQITFVKISEIDTFEFYVKGTVGYKAVYDIYTQESSNAHTREFITLDGTWQKVDIKTFLNSITPSIVNEHIIAFNVWAIWNNSNGASQPYYIDDVLLTVT